MRPAGASALALAATLPDDLLDAVVANLGDAAPANWRTPVNIASAEQLGIDLPECRIEAFWGPNCTELSVLWYLTRTAEPIITPQLTAHYGARVGDLFRWSLRASLLARMAPALDDRGCDELYRQFMDLSGKCQLPVDRCAKFCRQLVEEAKATPADNLTPAAEQAALVHRIALLLALRGDIARHFNLPAASQPQERTP